MIVSFPRLESRAPFSPRPSIDQADTMRRVSHTLETMACSLDRLLGLFVADPEMSGDAVHHHLLRCIGAGLPFGGQFLDSLAEPIG
jgi:hypothetical protein